MAKVVITIEDQKLPNGQDGLVIDVQGDPDLPKDTSELTVAQQWAYSFVNEILDSTEVGEVLDESPPDDDTVLQ